MMFFEGIDEFTNKHFATWLFAHVFEDEQADTVSRMVELYRRNPEYFSGNFEWPTLRRIAETL